MASEMLEQKQDGRLELGRREFIASATAAGALVLMADVASGEEYSLVSAAHVQQKDFSPDLFISIAPSGEVTIMAHRSEMGTGIRTTLPKIIADELEADWSKVTIQQAIGDRRYGSQNTDGSNSVRGFFDRMRAVGAKARTMLEQAAAEQWDVPVEQVKAEFHKIVDTKTKQEIGFGDLVEAAKELDVPKTKDLKFKPRNEWRYIGKPTDIFDIDDIVTGKAVYGVDKKMEGQAFALIKRPPVVGGKVKKFDATEIKKMPGVIDVIELPKYRGPAPAFQQLGGVAILADSTWHAWQAKDALTIDWEHGANADYDSKSYQESLKESVSKKGQTVRKLGDAYAELEKAETKYTADYSVPHLAHASMEVPAAVADVKTDNNGKATSCHMFACTQNPQAAQASVAQALGLTPKNVVVEVTLLGTGFGRKSKPDYCVEAALLSKESGRPVHVMMTREDDLRHDYYHTVSEMHLEAAVDEKGMPTAWLHRAAYPSIGSTFNPAAGGPGAGEASQGMLDVPFDIPNIQCETGKAKGKVRIGWLRAVCHIQQNFAVSSFADELAHYAKRNPKDYLLELLGEDRILEAKEIRPSAKFPYDIGRLKYVVERAAELAEWDDRYDKIPPGEGLGIACSRSFSSFAAHVYHVQVSKAGELKVKKVWVVLDAGTVVSPDRVKAQMEGSVAMTMGHTMFNKITFSGGQCEQSNYDSYPMVRMEHYPREIVTEIVENEEAPAGVGESTVASSAPALCNAIFAATGKRFRKLPLSDQDLSWS
ncbi:MAG: molybdopterin cofactor-binding domain-containing protein, partial [Planctomycetota bacterium]